MRTVYGLIVSVATILLVSPDGGGAQTVSNVTPEASAVNKLLVESAHYLAPTGGSSFIQVRVT